MTFFNFFVKNSQFFTFAYLNDSIFTPYLIYPTTHEGCSALMGKRGKTMLRKKNKNQSIQTIDTKPAAPVRAFKHRIAGWLVKHLYGRDMHISSYNTSLVAATAVFWYEDSGMRKFLMVRDVSDPQSGARFAGCLESKVDVPISETLFHTVEHMLGKPFAKALDRNLLEADRVCSAPVLTLRDKTTHQKLPVQGLVWLVRITKEQAQLCASEDRRLEVIAVPEFAVITKEVNPAHKVVFQSVERHLNHDHHNEAGMVVDRLEEFLKKMGATHKQVH